MLYFLVGQSNTGKDTILAKLLNMGLGLERFLYCTTRPMRDNEVNGREYWFKTENEYKSDLKSGKIVESREFTMIDGVVYYYTLSDIDLNKDYVVAGTIEQCKSYIKAWGSFVKPIRILVDDYNRLIRAIEREHNNKQNYKEVCRRFLDEFNEYTDENWNSIDFQLTVTNNDLETCTNIISNFIQI